MSVVLTVFTNSTVTIKEGDPKIHLNSYLNFTVKKYTSQKWNGRWQKQILGLPLSSNTLGAICHVGYVNK